MEKQKLANYIFIGFTCVGMAIGMFLRKPAIGAVLGVGLGFVAKAIYLNNKKD